MIARCSGAMARTIILRLLLVRRLVPLRVLLQVLLAASPTVPYADDDPNDILWAPDNNIVPEEVSVIPSLVLETPPWNCKTWTLLLFNQVLVSPCRMDFVCRRDEAEC